MEEYPFEVYVKPFKHNFIPVILPEDKLTQIDTFSDEYEKHKVEFDKNYHDDNRKVKTRSKTGYICEAAVEQLLNISFSNLSISDNSEDYDEPDLLPVKYYAGVKGVSRKKNKEWKYPVVKKDDCPNIICVYENELKRDLVWVCGIATTEVQNKYSERCLVKDKHMTDKKYGLYGFGYLLKLKTLDDLKPFKVPDKTHETYYYLKELGYKPKIKKTEEGYSITITWNTFKWFDYVHANSGVYKQCKDMLGELLIGENTIEKEKCKHYVLFTRKEDDSPSQTQSV